MVLADNTRQSLFIQPQTEACLINFGVTAGTQATGILTFADIPGNGETIAINGVTFTFVDGDSTSTNVSIGDTPTATAINLAAVLNASVNASISIATYAAVAETVTITANAGGTDGNAYTLANSSSSNVTRSAATLAGGSNTVGGIAIAQNVQFTLTAKDFSSIKADVYVVSATNAAKIGYLVG